MTDEVITVLDGLRVWLQYHPSNHSHDKVVEECMVKYSNVLVNKSSLEP